MGNKERMRKKGKTTGTLETEWLKNLPGFT